MDTAGTVVAMLTVRRTFSTRLGWLDAAIAVAVVLLNVTAGLAFLADEIPKRHPGPLFWALAVVPGLLLYVRRVAPVTILIAVSALTMFTWVLDYADVFLAANVVLYSAVAHGRPTIGFRAAVTAAVVLTGFTLLGVFAADVPFYVVGLVGLLSVAAITLASGVVTRDAYAREVEISAREAAAHRLSREAAAVAEERNRLARELHDVVAHGLAVISIQASAAERVVHHNPTAAAEALTHIHRTSHEALSDMRRVLAALRADSEAELEPTPGLTAVAQLVHDVSATGIEVDLMLDPRLTDSDDRVLGSTIFRFVQEALTNVIKHGGPNATVTVRVQHEDDTVHVDVSDTGRGLSARSVADGLGLTGMRERVEVLGGTFTSGPRKGGGYRVTARIPSTHVEQGTRP